jgi:hypothetical protein
VIDVLLVWLSLVGVWPFADPEHNFGTVAGAVDLTVHFAAMFVLVRRWTVVRRSPRPVEGCPADTRGDR